MMAAGRGNVKVIITSAEPLTKKQVDMIQKGVLKMADCKVK
jgi:F0F1-type ATP synthase delta subunit